MPGGPKGSKGEILVISKAFRYLPGRAGALDELYSQAAKTGAIGKARKAA